MIDATDRPQWPSYMDRPLSLLARAFAATDYDDNPQSAYSMDFRTMIADAITRDGLSVASFGVPEQAMINDNRASDRFWPTTIPGPV
jgi:hypothetical protein